MLNQKAIRIISNGTGAGTKVIWIDAEGVEHDFTGAHITKIEIGPILPDQETEVTLTMAFVHIDFTGENIVYKFDNVSGQAPQDDAEPVYENKPDGE